MSTPARVFADRYSLDVQITSSVGTPVWRAMDQVLKRWVTIYVMPRSDVRSPAVISACHKAAAAMPRAGVAIIDIVEQGTIRGMPTVSAAQEHLGVITEWTEGEPLERRLLRRSEPMPSDAALRITSHVAVILEQAHARGLHHSRLRPHNIVFDDNDDLRITGFGVEASMLGPDRSNGAQADVQGLGNLLFAMVTGKWPDSQVDGLPAARTDGPIPRPSSINSGVTEAVDRFFLGTQDGTIVTVADAVSALGQAMFVRAQDPSALEQTDDTPAAEEHIAEPEPQPATPPPYVAPVVVSQSEPAPTAAANPMPTLGELIAGIRGTAARRNVRKPSSPTAKKPARTPKALSASGARALAKVRAVGTKVSLPKRAPKAQQPWTPTVPTPRTVAAPVLAVPDTSLWHPEVAETRKRAILIALISVVLFGWLGWRMLTLNVGGGAVADPSPSISVGESPSPAASPSGSAPAARAATIVAIRDYDPYGDGAENSAKAKRAIDGNLKTAWQTNRYPSSLAKIKPGVGLVLSLGSAQPVRSVTITFTAPGASVSAYVSNQASPKQRVGQLLGSATNTGTTVTITHDTSLTGLYVLVWLTDLPKLADGGYQSGIDEVTVTLQ